VVFDEYFAGGVPSKSNAADEYLMSTTQRSIGGAAAAGPPDWGNNTGFGGTRLQMEYSQPGGTKKGATQSMKPYARFSQNNSHQAGAGPGAMNTLSSF